MGRIVNFLPVLLMATWPLLPVLQLAPTPPESEAPEVERVAFIMGTRLRVRVEARSRADAVQATEAAFAAVRRADALLSSWRSDSELAALNATLPELPVRTSTALFHLLSEAARLGAATGGAFDPAVGALVEAWDLRGTGRHPTKAELQSALLQTGFRCFHLEPADGTVERSCPKAWIDAGAFGKGAALRMAERVLREAEVTTAFLDFGGQLLLVGEPPDEEGWRVAGANPARRSDPAIWLRVEGGSVATTSLSERWVKAGGKRVGHVLDPRTGLPVPAWGSVTVVSEDPLVADLLSTALFVMGPEDGLTWADREGIAALFLIEKSGELSWRASSPMRPLIVESVPAAHEELPSNSFSPTGDDR